MSGIVYWPTTVQQYYFNGRLCWIVGGQPKIPNTYEPIYRLVSVWYFFVGLKRFNIRERLSRHIIMLPVCAATASLVWYPEFKTIGNYYNYPKFVTTKKVDLNPMFFLWVSASYRIDLRPHSTVTHVIRNTVTVNQPSTQARHQSSRVRLNKENRTAAAQIVATLTISFRLLAPDEFLKAYTGTSQLYGKYNSCNGHLRFALKMAKFDPSPETPEWTDRKNIWHD